MSKDDDFEYLALERGARPKVVWLRAAADRLVALSSAIDESLLVL